MTLPTWEEPFQLILVDEDQSVNRERGEVLRQIGFTPVYKAHLGEMRRTTSDRDCDFLLLAVRRPESANLTALKELMRGMRHTRLIALLADDMSSYDDLLRQSGAWMVLPLSLDSKQLTWLMLAQGEALNVERQNYRLRQMLDGRAAYENLVGGSAPMRSLYRLLDQVARTDTVVLISGEEGTERVEVARAIHQRSSRAIHPLVVIDCSQFIGDREGKPIFGPLGVGEYAGGPTANGSAFARADKGALVLHRVEQLHPEAQQRLLEFLHRPFFQNETPGTPQPLSRLMVTTEPNLLARVENGGFLRELFYRLNILQVRVPSLRERREDIPMLAQHHLRMARRGGEDGNGGARTLSFSSRALLTLFQYDWPGNLTELEELAALVHTRHRGPQVELEDLPEKMRPGGEEAEPEPFKLNGSANVPLREAKRLFETEYFKGLLRRTHGNMTLASRYSRVGRPYLYKKIREYGIQPEEFR